MQEIWKDINGYEGLYQVSNLGNIKSLQKFNKTSKGDSSLGYYRKEKILKPIKRKDGYLFISLSKESRVKIFSIHRLVAKTFIPNLNNYECVNHKDENKGNNCVNNLEWCTHKYNSNYGSINERISKKLKIPVMQFDLQNNFIKKWESATDVEKKLKIHRTHIGSCLNGKRKTAGGYIWKKAEKKQ